MQYFQALLTDVVGIFLTVSFAIMAFDFFAGLVQLWHNTSKTLSHHKQEGEFLELNIPEPELPASNCTQSATAELELSSSNCTQMTTSELESSLSNYTQTATVEPELSESALPTESLLPDLDPNLRVLSEEIAALKLREARKVASTLGIKQKIKGKSVPVAWLRVQIRKQLEEGSPLVMKALREVRAS